MLAGPYFPFPLQTGVEQCRAKQTSMGRKEVLDMQEVKQYPEKNVLTPVSG